MCEHTATYKGLGNYNVCIRCGDRVPLEGTAFDPAEGHRRKEEGMKRAADAAEPSWNDRFKEAIVDVAESHEVFTSEDVLAVVGLPTGKVGMNANNAVGALMNGAAKRGVIAKTGRRVTSLRPHSHGAELHEWTKA